MLRRSPARSGGSTVVHSAKHGGGTISVSAEFIATESVLPELVVHTEENTSAMVISPEDLIELGKALIEQGVRLQQRPTA